MKISPTADNLNARTMDEVFRLASPLLYGDGPETAEAILDLGAVGFVDPYAAVSLCVLVELLAAKTGARPRLLLPRSLPVRSYLSRVGVLQCLDGIAEVDGADTGASPIVGSEVLLGLTKIESADAINAATRRLLQILEVNLGYEKKTINAVANTISELCANILDHSGSHGWVVAQRYRRPDGEARYLWIGVADGGIGIKKSLATRYDTAAWSHRDAIVNALKKNFSRFPDRGLGLTMVRRIVEDFWGSLHIRSGDCRVYLGVRPTEYGGPLFPGTQVGIALSENTGA